MVQGKNLMRCKTYPGAEVKEGVGGLRDSYSVKSFTTERTEDSNSILLYELLSDGWRLESLKVQ